MGMKRTYRRNRKERKGPKIMVLIGFFEHKCADTPKANFRGATVLLAANGATLP